LAKSENFADDKNLFISRELNFAEDPLNRKICEI